MRLLGRRWQESLTGAYGAPPAMPGGPLFWLNENHQLGWWFQKAYSYKYVIKTPFDLLLLTCGLATARTNKSKGGHNG